MLPDPFRLDSARCRPQSHPAGVGSETLVTLPQRADDTSPIPSSRRRTPAIGARGQRERRFLRPLAAAPRNHLAGRSCRNSGGKPKQEATGRCLMALLASAGLPAIEPRRLASGARDWPAGYSGSVSHKGTTVVAALVPAGQARSLGIDIETRDGAEELSTVKGLSAVDELPPNWTSAGSVILFSVKEAAFQGPPPRDQSPARVRGHHGVVDGHPILPLLAWYRPLRLRRSRHPLHHRRPGARGIGGLAARGSHGIVRLIRSIMSVLTFRRKSPVNV